LLHQVGDLFELNVKIRCQKVNTRERIWEKTYLSSEKHIPFSV